MIVIKVGGSLFSHPRLGSGLKVYLDSLPSTEVLLVPGGGAVVEAVRELDRVHSLGDEVSHWLAIAGMDVMGAGLRALPLGPSARILECLAFARADDSRPGALPHSWDVTSDSIAARAAAVHGAERLVLLKSIDVPAGTSWGESARHGWVDRHFPLCVAGATYAIDVVNFRRELESLGAPSA